MLSYLHGYHAGNHADVLKHTVLTAILAQLTAKDKPLRYIDTHAGAGGYDLRKPAAQMNREYAGGIGRIWGMERTPPAVARLLDLVRGYNGGEELVRYPGSPWLAREVLRGGDSVYLFELHPAEHRTLVRDTAADRRVKVLRADGLEECIGLVPPPERRGLLLVDPSYEIDGEQRRVVATLANAHRRFATGVFAVWYPVIDLRSAERFERAVRAAGIAPLQVYELHVTPPARGTGLTGSGMIVVNPPWKLRAEMAIALPWLATTLGIEGGGSSRIAA
jgi:23S rRNA (adenine2030-N6)-methyltransferase